MGLKERSTHQIKSQKPKSVHISRGILKLSWDRHRTYALVATLLQSMKLSVFPTITSGFICCLIWNALNLLVIWLTLEPPEAKKIVNVVYLKHQIMICS